MTASASNSLLANAQLFEVSPLHVDEGERVGFLHEDKAAALGRLMAVFGQRDPIKVVANKKGADRPWKLVTGRHRLVGARIEGIPVWAIEVAGKSEELADMEASENLHRRPLGQIERAMFVQSLADSAQKKLAREHGELSQHQLAAKARWAKVKAGEITSESAVAEETDDTVDKMSTVCGWREDAAEALGLDKKEIQRSLTLSRLIIEPFPTLIEALAKHPVVGNNGKQLREIAQVRDEAARKAVIELLLDDAELSVEDAKVRLGIGLAAGANATPVPAQKFFNQISSGWGRLGLGDQRKFLPTLTKLIPTEMKRDMRDMLNKELGESGLQPAVRIHTSVKPEYIVCLEDGTRHTNLTKRLVKLGMTPAEYRERWSLPSDYPMLAPNYVAARDKAWRQRVRAARLGLRKPETADAR